MGNFRPLLGNSIYYFKTIPVFKIVNYYDEKQQNAPDQKDLI